MFGGFLFAEPVGGDSPNVGYTLNPANLIGILGGPGFGCHGFATSYFGESDLIDVVVEPEPEPEPEQPQFLTQGGGSGRWPVYWRAHEREEAIIQGRASFFGFRLRLVQRRIEATAGVEARVSQDRRRFCLGTLVPMGGASCPVRRLRVTAKLRNPEPSGGAFARGAEFQRMKSRLVQSSPEAYSETGMSNEDEEMGRIMAIVELLR